MSVRDLIPWSRPESKSPALYRDADPFMALHREVNRLFDDVFRGFEGLGPGRFPASPTMRAAAWPDVEVSETDKEIREKDIELTFDNGERRDVTFVTHPPRWHLKGGGYGGYRGWHHGDDKGPYYIEHDVWDLANPDVLREASTLSDHLIEWRSSGAVGFGIMEYGVGAGYEKYKDVQHLPTF